jgi:hypothetical protein
MSDNIIEKVRARLTEFLIKCDRDGIIEDSFFAVKRDDKDQIQINIYLLKKDEE